LFGHLSIPCYHPSLFQVVALIPVILVTSNCLYHVLDINHEFEVTSIIHRNTFHHDFLMQKNKYYPKLSFEAYAVMGRLNYSQEFPKIYQVARRLENATQLVNDIHAWPVPFRKFVSTYHQKDLRMDQVTDVEFNHYLYEFLFTQYGSQYQVNFKFETPIRCGQPMPKIELSMLKFYFRLIRDAKGSLAAKEEIDGIVRDANLVTGDGRSFVWSLIFYYWLPNSVSIRRIHRSNGRKMN
jgi:hypothetical protein